VPALLHKLGFSVQRPRKRLARADLDAQACWLRKRLPAVKKSRRLPRSRDVRGRGEALGAILFEMLSGATAHTATSLEALATGKLTQPARELATLAPDVDPAVAALVHRCLALRPDDRPASATEVAAALAKSERPSAPRRIATTTARSFVAAPTPAAFPRWALALLCAAVLGTMCFAGIALLGAGGTVWALLVSPRSSSPRPEGGTPFGANATPVQVTPVQATPAQAIPVQAAPAQATPVQATPAEATPAEAIGEGVSLSVYRLGGGDVAIERAIAEAARPTLALCRADRRIVEEVQFIWMGAQLMATQGVPTPPTATRCIEDAWRARGTSARAPASCASR
jgi:hypothetical protein